MTSKKEIAKVQKKNIELTKFIQELVKKYNYPLVKVNMKVAKITKYRYDKKRHTLYFF